MDGVEAQPAKRHGDAVEVDPAALDAAKEISRSSGNRTAAPIRKNFVRSDDPDIIPKLAALYSGGRSGIVAIKLYLAIVWRCSKQPYQTDKSARAWAVLLGLDDPRGKGSRRVLDALKRLRKEGLIVVRPGRPGFPNIVELRNETGDGSEYIPPGDAYYRAEQSGDDAARIANRYFQVDERLWLRGHIQSLRGPGLVLLLILLAEQGGPPAKDIWFSQKSFEERYRISLKTKTLGTKELLARGLVDVTSVPIGETGKVFEHERYRYIYRLKSPAVPPPPQSTLISTWDPFGELVKLANRNRR